MRSLALSLVLALALLWVIALIGGIAGSMMQTGIRGIRTAMRVGRAGVIATMVGTVLAACGGGGGGSPTPPATFTVGGTAAGLSGSGLILRNNGGDDLAISASGSFTFATPIQNAKAYSVSVAAQPASPGQDCQVANGAGTIQGANVTNVTVTCSAVPFTVLTHQPPQAGYLSLLLTDGSVMMQSATDAGAFYNLMPTLDGGYINGTWRKLASPPAGYAPAAAAQVVLADGRVLFVGGEYNQNQYQLPFAPSGLTNMSAVYDPVTDIWTMIPPPPGVAYIGDAPSAVLPDGSFVFGNKLGRDMWRLDPVSLTWTSL